MKYSYNESIDLARRNGFQVAYSNQAFELWLLLHFDYISGPLHCNQYTARLTELLGFPYSKHANTARLLFRALFDRQPQAIQNAQRLYEQFEEPRNAALEESSTTVHKLVKDLRRFI
ncbi:RloB family protein [Larkinella sp. GY13]|uniref:RloB family protein n=1 Tax=Larkinella sp. GY13 TaxID=3453720 RepID=UPI003EE94C49